MKSSWSVMDMTLWVKTTVEREINFQNLHRNQFRKQNSSTRGKNNIHDGSFLEPGSRFEIRFPHPIFFFPRQVYISSGEARYFTDLRVSDFDLRAEAGE